MRTRTWLLSWTFMAVFVAPPAHALLITLEPDNYAVGTNVTNLFEGVTLNRFRSHSSGAASYESVYVEHASLNQAATGTQDFGMFYDVQDAGGCWSHGLCNNGFSALLIQFDRPTNFVEVAGSWGGVGGGDNPYLLAFGSDQQLVSPYAITPTYIRNRPFDDDGSYVADFAGTVQIGSVTSEPFIYSALVGGWGALGSIDRIRYNSVPEPSSFLLLGPGLALFMIMFRKRLITG